VLGFLLAGLLLYTQAAFADPPPETSTILDCPATTQPVAVQLRAPDRYTFVRGLDECWLADATRTTENPLRTYIRFDPLREAAPTAVAALKWAIDQHLVREPAQIVHEDTLTLDGQPTPWAVVRGRSTDGRSRRDVAVLSLANGKVVVATHYDAHHRAGEDQRSLALFQSVQVVARPPEISANQ
jgi:hypothetical protein